MWNKIKYRIALLLLILSINQGTAQGNCWFSDLATITESSGNTSFKNFIGNDADGFTKFKNLHTAVGSNRINELLDPNVLRLFDRLNGGTKTRLTSNLDNAELVKFSDDFAGASSTVINKFNDNPSLIDSWKNLINRPKWVRKNIGLLDKISKKPELTTLVNNYYKNAIPNSTPKGFNGEGIYDGIKFNKYGHPELKPYVSDPNHIVNIDMKGNYSTDFTNAKKALEAKLNSGGKIVKSNPNGKWSPFYIEKNGVRLGPYTWHHHQNGKSMYPVQKEIHDKIVGKHTGGREIITKYPKLKGFFIED